MQKQMEQVKRLQPKFETLRELFLKSGNRCAFPGCPQVMMDAEGDFVGQICHIEAAEEGGERFNRDQGNEGRRNFSNLMLMCYAHHQKTNDVVVYTVQRLQEIKREHEAKFTGFIEKMQQSIVDETTRDEVEYAQTLQKMDSVLNWSLSGEQRAEMISPLRDLADRIKRLPRPTRQLLVVLVNRSSKHGVAGLAESRMACDLDGQEMMSQLHILEEHGFISVDSDFYEQPSIEIREVNEWRVFDDFKGFCSAAEVDLTDLIVELKFSLLD